MGEAENVIGKTLQDIYSDRELLHLVLDTEISILLRDDGIGMPSEIEPDSIDSLGLTLVKNLVRNQLKGKTSYFHFKSPLCSD